MNTIKKVLFICLFLLSSLSYGQDRSERNENRDDEDRESRTGSYTIDCIINGNCATSGDHISLTDLISSTDILSWKEGHGGYAVELANGQTHLMDFVETGIERSSYIDANTVINPYIQRSIDAIFYNESASFRDLLSKKLSEINTYSTELSFTFLAGVLTYNWIFVDFDLKPTPDIDSIAQLPGAKYIPLANRRQQTILIHTPAWKKLDDHNKVGLIFHELNYALVLPMFDQLLLTNVDMRLGSLKARELTSYLFRPISKLKKAWGFNGISNNYISHIFQDRVYDISTVVFNQDGSLTLPVGIDHYQISTQIQRLDTNSPARRIDWGMATRRRFNTTFDIESICKASSNLQKTNNVVTVDLHKIAKGNVNLTFNNSEVSSLEVTYSNDLKESESWNFNFQMNRSIDCSQHINNYLRNQ